MSSRIGPDGDGAGHPGKYEGFLPRFPLSFLRDSRANAYPKSGGHSSFPFSFCGTARPGTVTGRERPGGPRVSGSTGQANVWSGFFRAEGPPSEQTELPFAYPLEGRTCDWLIGGPKGRPARTVSSPKSPLSMLAGAILFSISAEGSSPSL